MPTATQNNDQIQVLFHCADPKYAAMIPSSSIMVPTKLKRFGLSEIINLLCESNVPFDFIINKVLLTTSLAKYIERHNISKESVLDIDVVKSLSPPNMIASIKQNDWISSIRVRNQMIFTGSFDATARIWNHSGECNHVLKRHDGPIKSVGWINDDTVLSASQDGKVIAWKVCLALLSRWKTTYLIPYMNAQLIPLVWKALH